MGSSKWNSSQAVEELFLVSLRVKRNDLGIRIYNHCENVSSLAVHAMTAKGHFSIACLKGMAAVSLFKKIQGFLQQGRILNMSVRLKTERSCTSKRSLYSSRMICLFVAIGCCSIFSFSLLFLMAMTGYGLASEPDSPNFYQLKQELGKLEKRMKTIKDKDTLKGKPPFESGDYEREINMGGKRRRYELHVPPLYNRNKPMPVILNFHGGGGRGATARLESRMDLKADQAGFIAVYPDGTGVLDERFLTWNAGSCCGYAMDNKVDDVGFIRALLDDLSKIFNIDQERIYATGLSNGGMMCYRLACELSDRIAAIAPIGGVLGLDDCAPKRPISIMHFHGTSDNNSPYQGGVGKQSVSKTNFRSVPNNIEWWVRRNGAKDTPVEKLQRNDVTIVTYRAKDETEVILVTIYGGGHTWPGGRRMVKKSRVGAISESTSANDMMWEFFKRHPLKK
jgi:polyhydroxybutyrate depolymerase